MPDVKTEPTPAQLQQRKVENLWAEGKTAAEIAVEMGWSGRNPNTYINVYRSRGYDLPHRQSVARVAASKSRRWPRCSVCGKAVPTRVDGMTRKHGHCAGGGKAPSA